MNAPVFNVMPSIVNLNVELNPAASLALCHFIDQQEEAPKMLYALADQLRYKYALRENKSVDYAIPLGAPFNVVASSLTDNLFIELSPTASGILSGFIRNSDPDEIPLEIAALGKQLQYHYACRQKKYAEAA